MASCLTSFLELVRAEVGACGIKYTGISDCTKLFLQNSNIDKDEMPKFEYTRFKNFQHELFLTVLQGIDFSFCQNADLGADAAYEMFESQTSQVVNRHASIKQAYQRKNKLPCMISSFKWAIFLKKIFSELMKITEMPKHGRSIG